MKEVYLEVTYPDGEVEYWLDDENVISELERLQKIHNGKVEVKKVARDLLQKLKEAKLVLDWRKKQRTRADVYHTVKVVLDELPRAYTSELYVQKCDSVYQHIYDSYLGKGKGVYEVPKAQFEALVSY